MGIKIWRHERPVTGPVRATEQDIDELNRVFSDSFTDRYRRDGMIGVRVPQLNPDIWNYAIRDAGDGAMIWRDEDDRLLAFNMSHYSGAEGWMGPLAVRSDRQGEGFGKLIVGAAIEWLKDINTKGTRPGWWPVSVGGGGKGSQFKGGGGGDNPWTREKWNKTAQHRFSAEHGHEKADRAAASAGTTRTGPKPAAPK